MKSPQSLVASGVLWSSASQATKIIAQIGGLLVLTRMLPPADFGIIAMASVITGLAMLFRDFGTTAAVIQRKELTSRLLDSVFVLNVLISSFLMLVLILISPLASIYFVQPRLAKVLICLSLTFPIGALGLIHQALLERTSNFQEVAIIESFAALLGLGVAIGAAHSGWGIYSLVFQFLVVAGSTTAGFWILSDWRPGRDFSYGEVKALWDYSGNLVGFNLMSYFARNIDSILIGRVLGATALGYYALAYRLMLWPLINISSVVGRAIFPVFSRLQEDHERIASGYIKATKAIMLFSAPLMVGVFVLRQEFVLVVLGTKWAPISHLLTWLVPVGLLQTAVTMVGTIYMATGRTRTMFRWGLFSSAVLAVGFGVGVFWGLRGIVVSYATVGALLFWPSLWLPFNILGLKVKTLVVSLIPILLTALAMGIIILLTKIVFGFSGEPTVLRLVLLVITGVVSYSALVLLFQRSFFNTLISAFRAR
jgi:PST family polysaccharide transporter